MAEALINGREYSYAQIRINIFGYTVEGISSVDYQKKRAVKGNYGRGDKIVSYGRGNIECSGKVKLSLIETLRIMAAIKAIKGLDADLTDADPFDVEAVYVPDDATQVVVVDKILSCMFMDDGRSAATGDTQLEHEYELFVGDIKFGAAA